MRWNLYFRIFVLFFFSTSFSFGVYALNGDRLWQVNLSSSGAQEDYANAVVVDSQNNIYVAGQSSNLISETSGTDWWIKKFNSSGSEDTTSWNKTYDFGNSEYPVSIAVDSTDKIYILGYVNNFASPTSGSDLLIKKFNSSGSEDTTSWNKNFSSPGSSSDTPRVVVLDSSDNVYLIATGSNLFNATSYDDWWIKKFNSSGSEDTTNWNKSIDYSSNDNARGAAVDLNNNLYVVGHSDSLASATSSIDWWIKKFNSSGSEDTTNWNKNFSSNGSQSDNALNVAVDLNKNVYVVGTGTHLTNATSNLDWWIKKFNSSGSEDTTNWNKNYSSIYISASESPNSVVTDAYGGVYVAGWGQNLFNSTSDGDWWIKKFNSSGSEDTTNWNKNYTSSGSNLDQAKGITFDLNNHLVVVGYGVNLVTGTSSTDFWIMLFDGFAPVSLLVRSALNTVKWQGYFGRVKASLLLGSGSNSIYNYGNAITSQIDSVFASTSSSFNFASLSRSNASDVDLTWNFSTGESDSATSFFVDGNATIFNIANVSTFNLSSYGYSGGVCTTQTNATYRTGLFSNSSPGSLGNFGAFAFGTSVVANKCAYDNLTLIDYELLVPINHSAKNITQTYYFYLKVK